MFKVGDRVKALVRLRTVSSERDDPNDILPGSEGVVYRVDDQYPVPFPYEVVFKCYRKDSYPCNADEIEIEIVNE